MKSWPTKQPIEEPIGQSIGQPIEQPILYVDNIGATKTKYQKIIEITMQFDN